jgi:phosphate transport system protein
MTPQSQSPQPTGSNDGANMTRTAYTHQIQELRDDVVAIASMVDKAIARAVDALRSQDVQLASSVVTDDKEINQLRWRGEKNALTIIATQGPMAADLRIIASALQIFTDLERMGDHAAGIAKIVIYTSDEALLKPLVDIPRMSQIAREMLGGAISAYINQDADAARKIAQRDDEVDRLYDQVMRELLTYMMADPSTITRATHLLWAAHDVERIADRVTNICERVVFSVTSEFEELDGQRSSGYSRLSGLRSASGTSG